MIGVELSLRMLKVITIICIQPWCLLHRRGGAREGRGARVRGAPSCNPELEEASQRAAGPRFLSGTGVLRGHSRGHDSLLSQGALARGGNHSVRVGGSSCSLTTWLPRSLQVSINFLFTSLPRHTQRPSPTLQSPPLLASGT